MLNDISPKQAGRLIAVQMVSNAIALVLLIGLLLAGQAKIHDELSTHALADTARTCALAHEVLVAEQVADDLTPSQIATIELLLKDACHAVLP